MLYGLADEFLMNFLCVIITIETFFFLVFSYLGEPFQEEGDAFDAILNDNAPIEESK